MENNLGVVPKKKRRNMCYPTLTGWLERRVEQVWAEIKERNERIAQFAHMTGLPEETLNRYLRGYDRPTCAELTIMCSVLGYSLDQLERTVWNPDPEKPLWRYHEKPSLYPEPVSTAVARKGLWERP